MMRLLGVWSDALHQECRGDRTGEHGSHGNGRADRKLRHAGYAVASRAAIGDASAQDHDETTGEGHRRTARQAVEANGFFAVCQECFQRSDLFLQPTANSHVAVRRKRKRPTRGLEHRELDSANHGDDRCPRN